MRPSSFKKDGWALIIPALLIVSGLTRDPLHTVALVGAMVACLLVAVPSIAGVVLRHRLAKTARPDEASARP
jgi:hypothetical protein